MKQYFYIFALTFAFTACKQSDSTSNFPGTVSRASKVLSDTLHLVKQQLNRNRLSYRDVTEVVKDTITHTWVENKGRNASLALHFDLAEDTLSVSYSAECWLMFPYKIDEDKIIIFWDTIIDSKYGFDIVDAIKKVDNKYIGKPFMILVLVNDTTLKASYPIPNLIKKINNACKERILFPESFNASLKLLF